MPSFIHINDIVDENHGDYLLSGNLGEVKWSTCAEICHSMKKLNLYTINLAKVFPFGSAEYVLFVKSNNIYVKWELPID